MTSTVLVLNAGSSSLKYQLVDTQREATLASGLVERVGVDGARLVHRPGAAASAGADAIERAVAVADHGEALVAVVDAFATWGPDLSGAGLVGVGHRVVMGGPAFDGPVVIDDHVVDAVERLSPLAPLHNPPNLTTVRVARRLLPHLTHVAVFDTAFFHHLPAAAATYALDRTVAARYGIRRYGFHGTSHQYVAARTAEVLGRDQRALRQIVLHLGNGASASAVAGGRAVETSMGLTPLEGLVMGTRTGDIDAAVVFHLQRSAGMSVEEVDALFNHRSGLLGLAGVSDMRDVHERVRRGDADARLALDVYVHRIRKYVGAYVAVLGGLDTLTFTAGIGENDPVVRAEVLAGLEVLGLVLDRERNEAVSRDARVISPDGAPVAVLVVPTNEELAIARQVLALVRPADAAGSPSPRR